MVYDRSSTKLNDLSPVQVESENRINDEAIVQVCYRVTFSIENCTKF